MDRRKTVHPGPDAVTLPHRARRAARGPVLTRTGVAAAAAATVAGAIFMATPAFAAPAGHHAAGASHQTAAAASYGFTTLDDNADPTFNQLLGINSHDIISGYFGSGSAGHPNQGYLLSPPYAQANYTSENFPGSVQTQVTGLNNKGDTAGFYVNAKGTSHGFVQWNGVFAAYTDPNTPKGAGAVNQLLGINDTGTAVGFYNDKAGNAHAYEVNQATSQFIALHVPGKSATATAINDAGDIVGFTTNANGTSFGWLLHAGQVTTLQFPGGSDTQPLGINGKNQIVGSYVDGGGKMHGFVLSDPLGPVSHWNSIDDPNGGSTVVNGINNAGDLVGFYADAAGNVDGMLATPNTVHLSLSAMPAGTVAFGQDSSGHLTVTPKMFGLTPGSAHSVVLVGPDGTTLGGFGQLTANGTGQASATLDGTFSGSVPSGSRLEILNGTASDSVSTEPIAETVPLSGTLSGSTFHLISVEVGSSGTSWGSPRGNATISYNPAAQTLTVTVTASGVDPGMHAAHIHLGSCQSQGGVQYMLMDFSANSQGQIQHETRTVTGVTTPIPAAGWYLNLHEGNSNNILSGGQPTIFFRPLLCANV